MKKYKIPAIVFGGGINGLGVIRNLGRNGITVYCVADEKDPVIYSRYCKKYYVVPHVQESKDVLRRFLLQIEKNLNNSAVLFSTNDMYSLHLSEIKDELEGSYYLPLASSNIIRTLVIKEKFYRSLCKYSVPHPKTFFPKSLEDVKRIVKEIKYPIFVKPSISQIFWQTFHKKGFVANSEEELIKYYLLALNRKMNVMLQEVIPGLASRKVFGIEGYFDKNSIPKALFAHCRMRGWPPMFGNTCLRVSIPLSGIIFPCEITKTYLYNLGYHGLMEAEWKMDLRDNTFKLLEINARQSMQNSLPAKCGINLTLISYLDSIDEKIAYLDSYPEGVKWIDFFNDLRSAIKTRTSIKEWIVSLKGVKEWSFFAIDDLKPWIISILDVAKEITLKRP
jgi:predicted ATP-grasp superfamily ATP-dependent carboligase